MVAMDQLYQQLIMDEARYPRGRGLAESFDGESFQVNPTCGDRVRLRVSVNGDQLAAVTWDGQGCAISMASTSIMTELTKSEALPEVDTLSEAMNELMHSRGQGVSSDCEDLLGDAMAFEGVSLYPMRIKCALLGWMALKDALAKARAGDNSPAQVPEGIES
ncbi:MAG: SUF system NifU family Fe-S cluster assembly protein [Micrococcales bacterium]|nr:SUF system NifU family Fe-S cluster assembly protein [Micrococcales bacterium]